MPRQGARNGRCTVCAHPERGRIDYLCATGQPLAAVAKRFDLGKDAVHRHFANHVTDQFKASARVGPFESEERLRGLCAEAGTSVIENLRSVYSGLASRWLAAIETGVDHSVIGLSRAMHENLRIQGQITQELMPAASVTVNAFMSSDWLSDFGRDLLELVREHPQIRGEVIALLQRRVTGESPQLLNVTPELVSEA